MHNIVIFICINSLKYRLKISNNISHGNIYLCINCLKYYLMFSNNASHNLIRIVSIQSSKGDDPGTLDKSLDFHLPTLD